MQLSLVVFSRSELPDGWPASARRSIGARLRTARQLGSILSVLALLVSILVPAGQAEAASMPKTTQPAAPPVLAWPADGPITTYFGEVGWTSPRGHAGLDIAAPWGAPVVAAAAGQVILAAPTSGGYGIEVILDHGHDLRTIYAHLSELEVEAGEYVAAGRLIGRVGSTGYSTGPHLHFEVRQGEELRDPLDHLGSAATALFASLVGRRGQQEAYRNAVDPA